MTVTELREKSLAVYDCYTHTRSERRAETEGERQTERERRLFKHTQTEAWITSEFKQLHP